MEACFPGEDPMRSRRDAEAESNGEENENGNLHRADLQSKDRENKGGQEDAPVDSLQASDYQRCSFNL